VEGEALLARLTVLDLGSDAIAIDGVEMTHTAENTGISGMYYALLALMAANVLILAGAASFTLLYLAR
jgi:hypothetical protein